MVLGGYVRRSFAAPFLSLLRVRELAAPLGHLLLSFFGCSSELDRGLEELENHYHQYDDHHYPDDPVLHELTSLLPPA